MQRIASAVGRMLSILNLQSGYTSILATFALLYCKGFPCTAARLSMSVLLGLEL